ncbi:hypothetical protein AMJ57_04680 [Parcubacteria bacterium SG8_24]|nr:MAG: hypothetical protein AMJ57_04680 [Parcubacteria bacterium SG8_24]
MVKKTSVTRRPGQGRGLRRGFSRGRGYGWGWGRHCRFWPPFCGHFPWFDGPGGDYEEVPEDVSDGQERRWIEQRLECLEEERAELADRLAEIK